MHPGGKGETYETGQPAGSSFSMKGGWFEAGFARMGCWAESGGGIEGYDGWGLGFPLVSGLRERSRGWVFGAGLEGYGWGERVRRVVRAAFGWDIGFLSGGKTAFYSHGGDLNSYC